ncbi:ATP-binding cassette domain-containing protein [Aggregatimonas sangjinii]|uniref:ATP-binding cassette domain-containing protein n=1 Tax=Aggregatimonas sangjinii TaxID=2583587 RepID=A0A5B7SW55_9FLAO|nr:ATP-binding cassette domain-containing protein [Aggregatimonas sangjinii]QCX00914.1 ATP-binding cassette domain-containing protein [Aggregatimonas sangjinii]
MKRHGAIFMDNDSDAKYIIGALLGDAPPEGFHELRAKKGMLFSKLALLHYIDEEMRHGATVLTRNTAQTLRTMSSGEQKKALLAHILENGADYMVLDNPFDNLDLSTQTELKKRLAAIAQHTLLIQLLSRTTDLLPFIRHFYRLDGRELIPIKSIAEISRRIKTFTGSIPPPLSQYSIKENILIQLKNVSVSYFEKPILDRIDWTIKKGEFWELRGSNGSGKTTMLSMITGENPKGYGQELYIFGKLKGSGESIWDIKKRMGYFTPAMTDTFTGYHSIEHMLISGLNDSVGLYITPSEAQLRLAKEWLALIGLWERKDILFHELGTGQKRLVMCARAMIKHPILLILDEPTAGLDDENAALFVALVNKFARESESAIVFVSHRSEPGLTPQYIYELIPGQNGSIGKKQ